MNKHRTHQIDDLAQRFLRDALPPTWVPNEQHRDYGKDYLVEIGEDNGDLTGSSFYVQLKGQEKAVFSADGSVVKYSLESKYAKYYFDKIKDLPVFLAVVDVSKKKGWWLFLQPVLDSDQTWRKQDSITVHLPTVNDITDKKSLRKAVEEAKKWMRLHHPESIHESVVAHKERITGADPRFDVSVTLVDDKPNFTLLAKEEVPLRFTFSGDRHEIGKKVSDLFDKGELVSFQPGEIKITGSKLFEQIEEVGCAIQARVTVAGTLALICRDEKGAELARLSDVPGQFSGGRKELWFEGGLNNSPLTIKLGPIDSSMEGSVQLNLNIHRWDQQNLRQLAFFERLDQFFRALPKSVTTAIECQMDGNTVFSVTLPLQSQPFVVPLAHYFELISKSRKIGERFNVNPVWAVNRFDQDAQDTTNQLYAIFFGSGWSESMPNVQLTASFIRKTFNYDVARKAASPGSVRFVSDCVYKFLGERIEVGRLIREYTQVSVKISRKRAHAISKRRKAGKGEKGRKRKPTRRDTVEIAMLGSVATLMKMWVEDQSSPEKDAGPSAISSESKERL